MTMRLADKDKANLRFDVGTRVECNTGDWSPGTVIKHFYVEKGRFPKGMCVPYQVQLDNGSVIFAPYDRDGVIRRIAQNFELHEAVGRGDVEEMKRLLEKDEDMMSLCAHDAHGWTVMHYAVDYAIEEPADGLLLVMTLLNQSSAPAVFKEAQGKDNDWVR